MPLSNLDISIENGQCTLHADAVFSTLGWSAQPLILVEMVSEPIDGLQPIQFTAIPPSQPFSAQVIDIQPLELTFPIEGWFRGVTILQEGLEPTKLRSLVKEQEPIGDDMAMILGSGIQGNDKLILEVGYGGGCKVHDFQLSWDGQVLKSLPPQIVLTLSHNSNGDTCKALINETLIFDLSSVFGEGHQYKYIVDSQGITSIVI